MQRGSVLVTNIALEVLVLAVRAERVKALNVNAGGEIYTCLYIWQH